MKKKETYDLYQYENALYSQGCKFIGGVDEVGRGPLIGSVVACCVVLPKDFYLEGLTDSKCLSEKKRNEYNDYIRKNAISIGIGVVDEKEIDRINIYEATKVAMTMAINNVNVKLDHILIDAMKLDIDIPSTSIIKGDAKSVSIAAASVVAKVYRDNMMYELDKIYPMYDLKNNKGYGTKKHIEAIKKYGITKYHRVSYKPVSMYSDNINNMEG